MDNYKQILTDLIEFLILRTGKTQGDLSKGAGYESETLAQAKSKKTGHKSVIEQLKLVYKESLKNSIYDDSYNKDDDKSNDIPENLKNLPFAPIPVYDIDIAASNLELYDDNNNNLPTDYYYIPEFSGCRAFNVYADSMEPLIPKGARIFARKIEGWKDVLEYGQVYAVGLHDGRRFIKYVRKGENKDEFTLRSENKKYEDFPVPKKLIRSIWLIDGWMNKQTQSTFFILNGKNKKPGK